MKKLCQTVIIGGGPAGCAAALNAIKTGTSDVYIIEKEPFGRHRIGEVLLTQTILEFKKLNIEEEIAEFANQYQWSKKFGTSYVHGGNRKPWQVKNNHPILSKEDQPHLPRTFVDEKTNLFYTLMVKRHEFDESLREICLRKGIKIIHGEVKEFDIQKEEDQNLSTIKNLYIETLNGETLILPFSCVRHRPLGR